MWRCTFNIFSNNVTCFLFSSPNFFCFLPSCSSEGCLTYQCRDWPIRMKYSKELNNKWSNFLRVITVLTDDTHITYALLKMIIRNINFFPVKRSDHNEYLTGNSLKPNSRTDFMTRAGRVYWPVRTKYHVVSGVLAPSFIHSFSLSFFTVHSALADRSRPVAVMTACQSTFTTHSLSFSVPHQEIVLFMLSLRLLYFSVSLLLLIHHPLIVCFTSVPLISNINSHPSIQITTATSVSFCSPPVSPVYHSFPFPPLLPLSPLFSVANVPKPQIHSSMSVFLSLSPSLSFSLSCSVCVRMCGVFEQWCEVRVFKILLFYHFFLFFFFLGVWFIAFMIISEAFVLGARRLQGCVRKLRQLTCFHAAL